MNGQSAILVDYNISNRFFELDVFQSDCTTKVNDTLKETETITSLGGGFKMVAVSVDINQTTIEGSGSSIWNTTATGGEINFCLGMSLFLDESKNVLVNFLNTQFKTYVDKTSGFNIATIDTVRTSADGGGDTNINYEEDIDAFQCDNSYSRIISPPDLSQGDIMEVCVQVEDYDSVFEVSDIFSFTIEQGSKAPIQVISNAGATQTYPALTEVVKNGGLNQIVKLKFQLLGSFFDDNNPDPLQVVGTVKLAVKSRRRHLLQDSNTDLLHSIMADTRKLQNDDDATFSMEVDLVRGSESNACKKMTSILSTVITVGGMCAM